jgi:type 1 glutamine amidotransferase
MFYCHRACWFGAALLAALAAFPFGAAAEEKKAAENVKPIRALLVIGGCCHDYAKQKEILAKGLANRAHVEVTVAYDPDTTTKHLNPIYEKPDWAKGFDVIIHDECSSDVKDLDVINRILEPHRQGLPGVVLHCGMHCYRNAGWPNTTTPWFEFTGLATTAHAEQLPIEVTFLDGDRRITKGLKDWTTIKEELYNNYTGKLLDTAVPLARGKQTNRGGKVSDNVVVWTNTYNKKARVFGTTLGHNNETVADPHYLDLVTRGLLWSVDKLDDKYFKAYDPSKDVKVEKPAQSKEPPGAKDK